MTIDELTRLEQNRQQLQESDRIEQQRQLLARLENIKSQWEKERLELAESIDYAEAVAEAAKAEWKEAVRCARGCLRDRAIASARHTKEISKIEYQLDGLADERLNEPLRTVRELLDNRPFLDAFKIEDVRKRIEGLKAVKHEIEELRRSPLGRDAVAERFAEIVSRHIPQQDRIFIDKLKDKLKLGETANV